MTTRSGNYTALVGTMGALGATTLHADERAQLLVVADALLFGDHDSEHGLARALDLIARLQETERWSAQSCAELREHRGCGPLPAGPERGGGARPPRTGSGVTRAARGGSSTCTGGLGPGLRLSRRALLASGQSDCRGVGRHVNESLELMRC